MIKNLTDDFLFRSNAKEFWALSAMLLGYGMRRGTVLCLGAHPEASTTFAAVLKAATRFGSSSIEWSMSVPSRSQTSGDAESVNPRLTSTTATCSPG